MMKGKMVNIGKMKEMHSQMDGMPPASVVGPGRSPEQAKKSIMGKLKKNRSSVAQMSSVRESAMANVSEAIGKIRRK